MFEFMGQLPTWLIVYFVSIIILAFVFLGWFYQELLKKLWFKTFYPEQVIKAIVHYPNNMFKIFYRLLPADKLFILKGKAYVYDDEVIQKQKEMFCNLKEKSPELDLDGKKYNFLQQCGVQKRFMRNLEIHYFENNPNPIDFTMSAIEEKNIALAKFSSKQLKQIKDNDLFIKLLSLQGQNNMMLLILLVSIASAGISLFMLLRDLGIFTQ